MDAIYPTIYIHITENNTNTDMIINRTVATAIFVSSVAVYSGMIASSPFFFHYSQLFQFPPPLHRLVTSFLITGPQLAVLLEPYFIYSYLSQLEKGNSKFARKEDLVWYLMFVGSVIIVSFTLPSYLNLILAFFFRVILPCLISPKSDVSSPRPIPQISARVVFCLYSYRGSWN